MNKKYINKWDIIYISIYGVALFLISSLIIYVAVSNMNYIMKTVTVFVFILGYLRIRSKNLIKNEKLIYRVTGYISHVTILPVVCSTIITYSLNEWFGLGGESDFYIFIMFLITSILPYLLLYIDYNKADNKVQYLSELRVGIGFSIAFVTIFNNFYSTLVLSDSLEILSGLTSFELAINVMMLSLLSYNDLKASSLRHIDDQIS